MSFFVKADEVDWQGKKKISLHFAAASQWGKSFLIREYVFLFLVHLDFLEIFLQFLPGLKIDRTVFYKHCSVQSIVHSRQICQIGFEVQEG